MVSFLFRTPDTFDLQVQEEGSTLKLYCPQRKESPGEQERAMAQSKRAGRCPNLRGCRRQCLSVSNAASLEGAGPRKRCNKHRWGRIPKLCKHSDLEKRSQEMPQSLPIGPERVRWSARLLAEFVLCRQVQCNSWANITRSGSQNQSILSADCRANQSGLSFCRVS